MLRYYTNLIESQMRLFIISWEMAHARIAFGSKIEPKKLPINNHYKRFVIYIYYFISNSNYQWLIKKLIGKIIFIFLFLLFEL